MCVRESVYVCVSVHEQLCSKCVIANACCGLRVRRDDCVGFLSSPLCGSGRGGHRPSWWDVEWGGGRGKSSLYLDRKSLYGAIG